MRYVSTRGQAPVLGFDDVLLAGLASDGGLYVPESIPSLDEIPDVSDGYAAVAAQVMRPFVGDGVVADRLDALCAEAYGGFADPRVAPLSRVDDELYLLELFWGPTLSFKDYALQLVGRMFDVVLSDRGNHVLVLGATSGDTGSAAIAGCEGREAIDVVILYPEGRVSDVQRRQMTTVQAANVRAVAVEGTFDDCQDLVKAAFGRADVRARHSLAAVNSINWARVMAQTAYYWWTAATLGRRFSVAVPTGNFGNVLAAWVARQMGAPIDRLIVGNNVNHGLSTLISTGRLPLDEVSASLAPAMDIAIPSNLERYLFELFDRSPEKTTEALGLFRGQGELVIDELSHRRMSSVFDAGWADDAQIESTMRSVADEFGLVIDPHTAVGWEVGLRLRKPAETLVVVSTAHAAKFSDAVQRATGSVPELPARAAHVLELPERLYRLDPSLEALEAMLDEVGGSSAS
jgi:threonine synthase